MPGDELMLWSKLFELVVICIKEFLVTNNEVIRGTINYICLLLSVFVCLFLRNYAHTGASLKDPKIIQYLFEYSNITVYIT